MTDAFDVNFDAPAGFRGGEAGGQDALLAHYRRRERELLALQDTVFDINRSRDTTAVLAAIVHRTRSVIGSDISYMSAYDPEREDFFMRAIEGAISPRFAEIRVPSHLGSCRPIVSRLQPFVTENYRQDPRFVHDPPVDQALEAEGIISMAGVPLALDGRVLGILYVADRYPRTYGPHEISLLLSLGAHAALAMENARLLEEARQAVQRLEATTAEIQFAIRVHEQLIALVAGGQGQEALAATLSAALNAGIAILDADHVVLGRHAPGSVDGSRFEGLITSARTLQACRAAVRESRQTGRSSSVDLPDQACRAMAIGSGGQSLGALIALREQDFSPSDIRTLERAALVTGIVLLSEEKLARSRSQDFEDAVRGVISGNRAARADLLRHVERGGLVCGQPLVLILAIPGERALGSLLSALRHPEVGPVLAGEVDGLAFILCPEASAPRLGRRLETAFSGTRPGRPSIVISRPFEDVSDLSAIHATCRRCLGLLKALGREGRLAHERDLAPYALLFEGRSLADLDAFIASKIGRLIEADAARGTHLVHTLLVYFDTGLDARQAAHALELHPNTLRQRLQTICTLLGLSAVSADALELHLAAKIFFLKTV